VGEDRRFSPGEVAELGQALCDAVAAVHAAGLLHRDIKAQNVMVSGEGRVALMDFGAGGDARAPSGGMAGTPLYLAPEVLSGSDPTPQADIYSIGVLLFLLLTGSYPVTGTDLDGLREAHAGGVRRSLESLRPDVPRSLRRVVERSIDPHPARRFSSAAALGAALARTSDARRVVLAAVAAGVVLLLAGILAVSRFAVPGSAEGKRLQIAVLPLASLTAGDDEYFADGLTDEIIRNLRTVRDLDVRSRTSSSAFKGRHQGVADVGRQLGVGYVLDGSVARAGGRLRVNAQLLRVDGEVTLWSEKFERELTVPNILSVQDDISSAIVNSLRLTLARGQRRYDTNLETYELFLRARALADRQGPVHTLQATKIFEKVIASDPTYAPAYAGLVLAYAHLSMSPYQGVPYEEAHPAMRAAAIRAVTLDPMSADAQAARGWVHAREFQWGEAEQSFRRALELDPGLAIVYTSFSFSTLQPLARLAEAEDLLLEAARRDPFDNEVQRALARVLIQGSRPSEAVAILQRLREIDSSLPNVDSLLGRALAQAGRPEESLPLLERRRERALNPGEAPHPWVALPYVMLGRRAEAERLARENDRLPFRRAIINAVLGDRDRMFDGLQEMAEKEPQRLVILLRDPGIANYRSDPRYTALLRRVNLSPG
jgi:serine/threonine-protein kinase